MTDTSKTVLITGASDGIGAAAARWLHADGHSVVVIGRSAQKTQAVASELGVEFHLADFSRLQDVRRLAAELDAAHERIDVLANNAGGIFGKRTKTADGFELTFQVNHLAPFLLTQLLMPKLIASRAAVIQTSSSAARVDGKLDIDDLDHDRKFSAGRAYGSAKLENILFTTELDRRYREQGIAAAAFHPGIVATGFASGSSGLAKFMWANPFTRRFMTTPERGAAQLVWLAEGTPGEEWVSGTYYEKFKPATRVNPQARDATLARKLWERSEALLQAAGAGDRGG
jgi:NAD(P)-dependent dehydrogenase (short-subunit alcohol dehydrogenase family)